MARRRRAPITNHPLTPYVTTLLTFAGVAVLVVVTQRLGFWERSKGEAMWSVVFLAPVLFLYFFYDPITSALDRWATRDRDRA